MQGLTQVEEMLISRVLPIMSVYRLPHGQYGYSGHVINLPQDVASFATSLPRLPSQLDVIVVRRDGAAGSHRDFKVRRSVVLRALQWLLANNIYYRHVHIDQAALSLLPADGDLTDLVSVTIESSPSEEEQHTTEGEDPYNAHLSRTFIPNTVQRLTEQETVRQSIQDRQHDRSLHLAPSHGLLLELTPSMSSPQRGTFLGPSPLSFQMEQPISLPPVLVPSPLATTTSIS